MNSSLYPQQKTLFKYPMNGNLVQDDYEIKHEAQFDKEALNDLVEAIGQDKDRDAFITLFQYFAPRIKSFLMKSGLSAEMADELSQETMLTIWNKAEQFDSAQASASTWIYTIARNKKIDFFRKNAKQKPGSDDAVFKLEEPTQADSAYTQEEQNQKIVDALSEIPADQADLIYKAYFEDKTHKDIAEETNIPLGTVKSRIRLALERMRYLLDGVDL